MTVRSSRLIIAAVAAAALAAVSVAATARQAGDDPAWEKAPPAAAAAKPKKPAAAKPKKAEDKPKAAAKAKKAEEKPKAEAKKAEEKPKTAAKKVEEKPKAEAKKAEEKPKADAKAKKADEKPKAEAKAKKAEDKPKAEARTVPIPVRKPTPPAAQRSAAAAAPGATKTRRLGRDADTAFTTGGANWGADRAAQPAEETPARAVAAAPAEPADTGPVKPRVKPSPSELAAAQAPAPARPAVPVSHSPIGTLTTYTAGTVDGLSLSAVEVAGVLRGRTVRLTVDGKDALVTFLDNGELAWTAGAVSGRGGWWTENGRFCDRYAAVGDWPGRGAQCTALRQRADSYFAGETQIQFVN